MQVARLGHLHPARQQVLLGHERAGVVVVKVEEMHRDAVFAQEVVERRIGIERPEHVEVGHVLHGQKPGLALAGLAVVAAAVVFVSGVFEGVVLAREAAGVEEVERFFHRRFERI